MASIKWEDLHQPIDIDLSEWLPIIAKISRTREILSAIRMQGSAEDQQWLRALYQLPHPPSYTDFRSLPSYNNKRGTHHKMIGQIFAWMGNEMIPRDQGIHWMTVPITFFISLATVKTCIRMQLNGKRNATRRDDTKIR